MTSLQPVPKNAPWRSPEKLAWLRGLACAFHHPGCPVWLPERRKIEAMHVRGKRRFGDRWAVPACPGAHQRSHDIGIESFGREVGVDPVGTADEYHRAWVTGRKGDPLRVFEEDA